MKASLPAVALIAFLGLAASVSQAAAPAAQPAPQPQPQAQAQAQDLANSWVRAYNTHNRAALGAMYTQTAQLMMHGKATISGRQAIQEFWASDFLIENPLTVLSVTHTLQGVDMMLVHGNYQVVNRESGEVVGQGRFAHIWTKQNGNWLLDRDLWLDPFQAY